MKKPIGNNGHRARLRQKFLDHGLDKFTDDEIVELLLTLGTPRRDCKKTARAALREFGSLAAVLEASSDDLQKVEGVGPANAFGLRLIQGVSRRYLRERMLTKNYIASFDDALDYFSHALRAETNERLHILYLSSQNAILGEERLTEGGSSSVSAPPRRIVERALAAGATTVALAHNHPGGVALPSEEDKLLTKELLFAARMVELSVRDHLIIAGSDHYSFSKEGLIKRFEKDFDAFYRRLLRRGAT